MTVQLIDGRTGTTKWSQRYDLHSADILSFEDQVATKVVEGLRIEISPTEQKSIQQTPTTSVDAYNDYLQARFYLNEYLVYSRLESIEKGKLLLVDAISLDRNFADAYALLAEFCTFQSGNFAQDADANLKRGELAAQNALRINPESSEGLIALGGIYGEEGRNQEAIRTSRQAVALAPNSETAWQMLGYSYYYSGLNELAEQAYRRAVALNPAPPQPHWMHSRMLLYVGRANEAEHGDQAYWLGGIYALLGERQSALDWLKRTVALGDVNYPWFERDKNYDSLRADPEYRTIMAGVRQRWETNKKEFEAAP